uniref:Putative secreted protein n=1 Tax=Amblyomma triste TaxID=251400 RepID=A0A023G0Y6_AMBTT
MCSLLTAGFFQQLFFFCWLVNACRKVEPVTETKVTHQCFAKNGSSFLVYTLYSWAMYSCKLGQSYRNKYDADS